MLEANRNRPSESVKQTFLALRLAPVLLVVVLGISVGFNVARECHLTSISAYYYTSSGPAFIGMLCAIGVCLIINRGDSDAENILLDFAGFLAFIVAFVPTGADSDSAEVCQVLIASDHLTDIVRTNAIAVLTVGVIATGIGWFLRRNIQRDTSPAARASIGISGAALLVGIYLYHYQADWFVRNAHLTAAFTMFGFIAAVVAINGWQCRARERLHLAVTYAGIFGFMVVGFSVLLMLGIGLEIMPRWLFYAEAVLILGFASFWILQTYDLRGNIASNAVTDEVVQNPS